MLFTRNSRFDSNLPAEEIKKRLVGQHVKVHHIDFEIFEKDATIKIIPHAEQETNIKTLPITHVEFAGKGAKTQVNVVSKMRKIDKGGPMILLTFVFFMLAAALIMLLYFKDEGLPTSVLAIGGISLFVFIIFWFRLERGYFDYIRKIQNYVKQNSK